MENGDPLVTRLRLEPIDRLICTGSCGYVAGSDDGVGQHTLDANELHWLRGRMSQLRKVAFSALIAIEAPRELSRRKACALALHSAVVLPAHAAMNEFRANSGQLPSADGTTPYLTDEWAWLTGHLSASLAGINTRAHLYFRAATNVDADIPVVGRLNTRVGGSVAARLSEQIRLLSNEELPGHALFSVGPYASGKTVAQT